MTDHAGVVANHNADQPTDQSPATDRRPTDHDPVALEVAADALGITVNAVRQRLKRGTLQGERTAAGWVVFLATVHATTPDRGRHTTDRPAAGSRPATNQPIDQAPLAALISDLTRRNEELAAAAALWQERARFLGERLQALEAGPITGEASDVLQEHDPGPERDVTGVRAVEASQDTQGPAWRRLWCRVTGGRVNG